MPALPSILLIGGGSASGKSRLAEALAQRLNARYIDLDLFWIVLQRALPAAVEPDLHLFEPDSVWTTQTVGDLVERYLRAAACVCRHVEPVIAHHDIVGAPAVIEGSWLLPEFARKSVYAGRNVNNISAIFLHETSAAAIEQRIDARLTPWWSQQPRDVQRSVIETHFRYGDEIKRRAESLAFPVLESQPIDTLLDRALAALDTNR